MKELCNFQVEGVSDCNLILKPGGWYVVRLMLFCSQGIPLL